MRSSIGLAAAALLLGACGGGEEANNGAVAANEALAIEAEDVTDASADSLVAVDDNGMGNGEMPAEDVGNTGDLPVTDEGATNAQ
jgi:hypothetical protein